MNLVALAQLILFVLRNLNLKPRKHKPEEIALAIAAYVMGVQITKLNIPPSTLYYYTKKLGVKRRKDARPRCPSCNSDRVIKNGSSRGKSKYKCKVCGRTFYRTASHRMSREQRERILREYTNRMSLRGISKVEGRPLTTVYSSVKRAALKAYVDLSILQAQLKAFRSKFAVLDESWTYVRVRRGPRRQNLWIWNALIDGVPFFVTGDRDYNTFRLLWLSLPKCEVHYTDDYPIYQVLYHHVVGKKYTHTVESYNSFCRSHLARLARDTKAVNRSRAMIDYSLDLLNVMYPQAFTDEKTPLNLAYLSGVQYIRDHLI